MCSSLPAHMRLELHAAPHPVAGPVDGALDSETAGLNSDSESARALEAQFLGLFQRIHVTLICLSAGSSEMQGIKQAAHA